MCHAKLGEIGLGFDFLLRRQFPAERIGNLSFTDKNSLFGGPSIGKMELCVKGEKAATSGALGLLYRSVAYEDVGAGQPNLFND